MKELNEIDLGKGLFTSVEGKLCLTKGHLGNREGQVEVEYSPHWKLLLIFLTQIFKKSFFFKKGAF